MDANKYENPQREITFWKICDIDSPEFKKKIKQHLSQQLQHHNRSVQLNKLIQIYRSTKHVFDNLGFDLSQPVYTTSVKSVDVDYISPYRISYTNRMAGKKKVSGHSLVLKR